MFVGGNSFGVASDKFFPTHRIFAFQLDLQQSQVTLGIEIGLFNFQPLFYLRRPTIPGVHSATRKEGLTQLYFRPYLWPGGECADGTLYNGRP